MFGPFLTSKALSPQILIHSYPQKRLFGLCHNKTKCSKEFSVYISMNIHLSTPVTVTCG